MEQFYIIKDLRDNTYVSIFFESQEEAIKYAENNFDYYFTFTIEKVYQITKN